MTSALRLALAQADFCVGDITGNAEAIIDLAARARGAGADVVVMPELAITGYPPEDLLFRPGLHARVAAAIARITREAQGIHVVFGYPEADGARLYNSCLVLRDGVRVANYRKQALPNYAVFDEKRWFTAGDAASVLDISGVRVGLSICEDIWTPATAAQARAAGAELILNINASPYHLRKAPERLAAVRAAVAAGGVPVAYVNTVGGQDELVFDGGSFALNADGALAAQASAFASEMLLLDVRRENGGIVLDGPRHALPDGDEAEVYAALVLGIRDYIRKNRFPGAVLGLSGGIDSALTLALAIDALGADQIMAVSMPSRYTAQMSIDDALEQARNQGCECHVVPIEGPVSAFGAALAPVLQGKEAGVTAENVQARSRGVILMAISNATGRMVLTTGNKSEMAVGYATLYGDMAGGFAPLKDIPKLLVYRLARWRNAQSPVIPERVIVREPSAELRPDQKDSDSLPPYEVLDPILEGYVEQDLTPHQVAAQGYDLATVKRVAQMVDRNEYKRRQAAPGVRIGARAFGRDRRFPITSRYSEQDEPSD
ncbi:MAG: NAD+ synthase [Gammaproteobacteria bacterium]|nr:NAD+ synthase [Gammaproteobacteria bacterium]